MKNLNTCLYQSQPVNGGALDEISPGSALLEGARAKFLVIFDFDWTLLDENSDTWVLEQLGGGDVLMSSKELPWTELMDIGMGLLHVRGRTSTDIYECLRKAPLQPAMAAAFRHTASSPGCEVHVVSDANSVFIHTVLEVHQLAKCAFAVHTNPAHFDSSGALRILPYHPAHEPPHGCHTCQSSPNMCKGQIVADLRMNRGAIDAQIVYLGDGGGDYCPCLALGPKDFILAREGFPLLKKLQKDPELILAQVLPWFSGQDVGRILDQILPTRDPPALYL